MPRQIFLYLILIIMGLFGCKPEPRKPASIELVCEYLDHDRNGYAMLSGIDTTRYKDAQIWFNKANGKYTLSCGPNIKNQIFRMEWKSANSFPITYPLSDDTNRLRHWKDKCMGPACEGSMLLIDSVSRDTLTYPVNTIDFINISNQEGYLLITAFYIPLHSPKHDSYYFEFRAHVPMDYLMNIDYF